MQLQKHQQGGGRAHCRLIRDSNVPDEDQIMAVGFTHRFGDFCDKARLLWGGGYLGGYILGRSESAPCDCGGTLKWDFGEGKKGEQWTQVFHRY